MTFAAALMVSGTSFAEETKTSTTDTAVQAITGKEKKSRKKKVEMCAECGKPESECECHDKDGKKVEGKKAEHKAGETH